MHILWRGDWYRIVESDQYFVRLDNGVVLAWTTDGRLV